MPQTMFAADGARSPDRDYARCIRMPGIRGERRDKVSSPDIRRPRALRSVIRHFYFCCRQLPISPFTSCYFFHGLFCFREITTYKIQFHKVLINSSFRSTAVGLMSGNCKIANDVIFIFYCETCFYRWEHVWSRLLLNTTRCTLFFRYSQHRPRVFWRIRDSKIVTRSPAF